MMRTESAADEKAPRISIGRVSVITVGIVWRRRIIPPARKWNSNTDKDSCFGRSRSQGHRAEAQYGNQDHSEMLEPRVPCESGHSSPPDFLRPFKPPILLIRYGSYFYPRLNLLPLRRGLTLVGNPLTASHRVAAAIASAVAFLVSGPELRGILRHYSVFRASMRTGAEYPRAPKSQIQGAA
jgi:hypothetical protein